MNPTIPRRDLFDQAVRILEQMGFAARLHELYSRPYMYGNAMAAIETPAPSATVDAAVAPAARGGEAGRRARGDRQVSAHPDRRRRNGRNPLLATEAAGALGLPGTGGRDQLSSTAWTQRGSLLFSRFTPVLMGRAIMSSACQEAGGTLAIDAASLPATTVVRLLFVRRNAWGLSIRSTIGRV